MSTSTVARALARASERLRRAGIEAPRAQARALLEHVLSLDTAALLARLHEPMPAGTVARFEQLIERRAAHEPLQYLLGRAPFRDFEVAVRPGVFIPRPETELLVDAALEAWLPERDLAVDLCSGSGAIAIALARARPAARVLAIELSAVAAGQAAANVRAHNLRERVRVIRADLMEALRPGPWRRRLGVVACNPPYARDVDVLQPEVRDHEPRLAWEAGPRGTEVYERLLPAAARLLPAGVSLVLELGYDQSRSVPEMLRHSGCWQPPRLLEDFQGIARVLVTRRAPRSQPPS